MDDINHPVLKASVAAASFVAIDWLTTAGKVCAALTAIVIFGELLWKKAIRPLLEKL